MGDKVSTNETYFTPFLQTPKWTPGKTPCSSDPELWSDLPKGQSPRTIRAIQEICKTECPVVEKCLENALIEEGTKARQYRWGIRGGFTPKQRYALYKERNSDATKQ